MPNQAVGFWHKADPWHQSAELDRSWSHVAPDILWMGQLPLIHVAYPLRLPTRAVPVALGSPRVK